MTELNPDITYWQQRAAKLEKERDDAIRRARAFEDVWGARRDAYREQIERGGLGDNRLPDKRDDDLRQAVWDVRKTWRQLGFYEAVRDQEFAYYDVPLGTSIPTSDTGGTPRPT